MIRCRRRAAVVAASLWLALGAAPGIAQVPAAPGAGGEPMPAVPAVPAQAVPTPVPAREGSVPSVSGPRYVRQVARQLRAVIRDTPVQLVTTRDDLLTLRIPVDYLFALDATQLRTEGPRRLDPLVATLLKSDRTAVVVAGHSDSLGTREFNAAFTLQRATAVAGYLLGKGIPAERVVSRGAGEMERMEKNEDSPAARARNRRIELEIRPFRPLRREAS